MFGPGRLGESPDLSPDLNLWLAIPVSAHVRRRPKDFSWNFSIYTRDKYDCRHTKDGKGRTR
jgi:hypothetical protein